MNDDEKLKQDFNKKLRFIDNFLRDFTYDVHYLWLNKNTLKDINCLISNCDEVKAKFEDLKNFYVSNFRNGDADDRS